MYSLMFSLACCLRIDRSLFTVPSDTLSICAISPWIHGIDNNHEHFRTVEQIVSGDKGGMIISPRSGLRENVFTLDYDSEYANLIINHNLSYETVGGEAISQPKKGLLPTIVERMTIG